jgi:hypothetical protein
VHSYPRRLLWLTSRLKCWSLARHWASFISFSESVNSIDYASEDGRFLVLTSYVKISNPYSFSSSETGVDLGIRSWNSTYPNELDVGKQLVVSISQRSEELRLQPGLKFVNFEPPLESFIFKCFSWLNGSFLAAFIMALWKMESRLKNCTNFA